MDFLYNEIVIGGESMFFKRKKESGAVNLEGENIVRMHFVFYGQVQRVGFRFTAMQAAEHLGITGWVRNERNGTVTMEAQGPKKSIDEMIRILQNDRYIRITDYDAQAQRLNPVETEFIGLYS